MCVCVCVRLKLHANERRCDGDGLNGGLNVLATARESTKRQKNSRTKERVSFGGEAAGTEQGHGIYDLSHTATCFPEKKAS